MRGELEVSTCSSAWRHGWALGMTHLESVESFDLRHDIGMLRLPGREPQQNGGASGVVLDKPELVLKWSGIDRYEVGSLETRLGSGAGAGDLATSWVLKA